MRRNLRKFAICGRGHAPMPPDHATGPRQGRARPSLLRLVAVTDDRQMALFD